MCLEEYTQEYVDELHEIELERFKKRADQAETRANQAETELAKYREKYGILD